MWGSLITGAANVLSSIFGGKASTDNTRETNQTNLQIARETNAQSERLFNEANEFNALQSQLDRDFQAGQAQINRDFESIGSQVKRAMDAGIQPSAILSGGMGSSPVQPSSNAATSSGLPHLTAATMQNNADNIMKAWSQAAQTGLMVAQAENIQADTANKEEENKILSSDAEVRDELNRLNIDVKGAELNKITSEVQNIQQETENLKKNNEKTQKEIDLLVSQKNKTDLDAAGQKIDNYFKSPMYDNIIKEIESKTDYNRKSIDIMTKRFILDKAIGQAQIGYFSALKDYYGAQVEMSGSMTNMYNKLSDLYGAQSNRERLGYIFDKKFGALERKYKIEESKGKIKQYEWQNSDTMHFLDGFNKVATGVGMAVGSAAGAFFGMKGLGKGAGISSGKNTYVPSQSQTWTPIPK